MSSVTASTLFATRLMLDFVARGLTDVVLCPGSRSQALALAAMELEKQGVLRVHVRVDERAAGFLALGLGMESGRPAAIVTTSGTAVANLYPAVLEAHHSGQPMIVLTADRPEELRGIGSNQTTVQTDFFSHAVRFSRDVDAPTFDDPALAASALAGQAWSAAVAEWARGPVHLNLAFRDPLSGGNPWEIEDVQIALEDVKARRLHESPDEQRAATRAAEHEQRSGSEGASVVLARGPKTVVIAGTGAGPQAEQLAFEGGWPLIAEIASGARFGRNVVPAYREVLRAAELTDQIERIIVFGHPTLSREVPALIADSTHGRETIVVIGSTGENFNPGHNVTAFVDSVAVGTGESDRDWLGAWMRAGHAAHDEARARYTAQNPSMQAPNIEASRSSDVDSMRAFASAELAAAKAPVTRELLVDALWRATWPHDRLLFGASRLVRVADRTLVGKKVPVFANRGLAGIDGTISTGVGIALASGALTRVLLGDLAALHDAGGMLIGPTESRPRIQVVVGNDGGGTIFDSLEVAATTDTAVIDRAFYTPHGANFEALAGAYGWEYVRVATASELERALTLPAQGPQLVEVVLAR